MSMNERRSIGLEAIMILPTVVLFYSLYALETRAWSSQGKGKSLQVLKIDKIDDYVMLPIILQTFFLY